MNDVKDLLNTNYIDEFVSIAGTEPFNSAIELFNQGMDEYLNGCRKCFGSCEFEDAAKELHKLKGAASSIGLARVMKEAKVAELKLLEERDAFDLENEICVLKLMAESDLIALKTYLVNK